MSTLSNVLLSSVLVVHRERDAIGQRSSSGFSMDVQSKRVFNSYGMRLYFQWFLSWLVSFGREGGGGVCLPLGFRLPAPQICWDFYFTCNCKSFNDTKNCKLCLCENSPRFHQIASNNKMKISQGSMPPDPPSLPHALHTDTYLSPLPIICTI